MLIILIITAVLVGIAGFYLYPVYVTVIDAFADLASSMIPGFSAFDDAFFKTMPYIILLLLIWLVINIGLSKVNILGGGQGGEGGEQ